MTSDGKPGRRPGTPTEYQDVLRLRLRKARDGMSWSAIAKLLTERMGRFIAPDTCRQWERISMLPHDAILPICDITRTHPYAFLGPITEEERAELKKLEAPKGLGKHPPRPSAKPGRLEF